VEVTKALAALQPLYGKDNVEIVKITFDLIAQIIDHNAEGGEQSVEGSSQ